MVLTKEQLSELICKHSERENGLQDLLEILLESMMVSERREYLRENSASGNKCNGFRPGHSYGHGRTLTFRIPRDRYGNFHPRILAILRHQEDECERLAGPLYTKGLTQEQVGEVFQDIYGEHYSKASISRMLDYLREDVSQWLTRSLEAYYPIVFIDCVHMKIHRKRSVETEAFYVVLAVREDKRREVLGVFNKPTESALGWVFAPSSKTAVILPPFLTERLPLFPGSLHRIAAIPRTEDLSQILGQISLVAVAHAAQQIAFQMRRTALQRRPGKDRTPASRSIPASVQTGSPITQK